MRSNLTTVGDNTSNQNIKINLMMKIFEYLVNKQYAAWYYDGIIWEIFDPAGVVIIKSIILMTLKCCYIIEITPEIEYCYIKLLLALKYCILALQ